MESVRFIVVSIVRILVSLLIVLSRSITVLSLMVVSVPSLLHANKTQTSNIKRMFFIIKIFNYGVMFNYIAKLGKANNSGVTGNPGVYPQMRMKLVE